MIKEAIYWICPANKNHKFDDERVFRRHLDKCKELKRLKIYKCPYSRSHVFLDERERDQHILNDDNMMKVTTNQVQDKSWRIVQPFYEPPVTKKKKFIKEEHQDQFKPPLNSQQLAKIRELKKKIQEKKKEMAQTQEKQQNSKHELKLKEEQITQYQEQRQARSRFSKLDLIEKLTQERIQCENFDKKYSVEKARLEDKIEVAKKKVFKESKQARRLERKITRKRVIIQREQSEKLVKEMKRQLNDQKLRLNFAAQEAKKVITNSRNLEERLQRLKKNIELRKIRRNERYELNSVISLSDTGSEGKRGRSLATKFKYEQMKSDALKLGIREEDFTLRLSEVSSESESETSSICYS